MGEFVLRIQLGNDAMQTADDVADALASVADRLFRGEPWDGQGIRDRNGNTVGSWNLEGSLP